MFFWLFSLILASLICFLIWRRENSKALNFSSSPQQPKVKQHEEKVREKIEEHKKDSEKNQHHEDNTDSGSDNKLKPSGLSLKNDQNQNESSSDDEKKDNDEVGDEDKEHKKEKHSDNDKEDKKHKKEKHSDSDKEDSSEKDGHSDSDKEGSSEDKKHKKEKHSDSEKDDSDEDKKDGHSDSDEEKHETDETSNIQSREISFDPETNISDSNNTNNDNQTDNTPSAISPALLSSLKDSKGGYNKRNSTSTLFIRGTVSNPDIVELLKCISLSIQKDIKDGGEDGEVENNNDNPKFRIFDERMFPIQENPDIDITQIPQEFDIFLFIGKAFDTENLAPESAIMMRAYIDRLSQKSGLVLYPWNWRRVVLSTLILATKVWEEEEVWNTDFKSVLPCLQPSDLNQLEKNVLNLLQYSVSVKSSDYAKYYFEVRSLKKGDFLLPDVPLDNVTAELIEAKSKKREDAINASNSFASKRREIASYNPGKLKSSTPAVLS